jgi:putative glycosyltransferase (TIGR04372 family)
MRKLTKNVTKICCLIIGVLINVLIRLCRPIIHIRFGYIMSSRIGEIAPFIESYLNEKDVDKKSSYFDIFCVEEILSNKVLIEMYSKWIRISKFSMICRMTLRVNRLFYDSQQYEIHNSFQSNPIIFSKAKQHLYFNSEQEVLGKSLLQKLGLPRDCKYVCFFARDEAFLNEILPDNDWTYHDYRNADIKNYLPAIEELIEMGYYAIRVGSIVKNGLGINNKHIIDYSLSEFRSEFMDLYLLANCDFYIGDTSGLIFIPQLFNKPCIALNLVGCGDARGFMQSKDLILFKKMWSVKGEKYISLNENNAISNNYSRSEYYEHNDIKLFENTPDEIKDIVLEMESRIKGDMKYSAEDDELQEVFKSQLLAGTDMDFWGRLGKDALRQNKDWFLEMHSDSL